MAWLQSHQELRSHPKTKKAARKAGVSLPTMVGHLHLLWWWALDHAPDGDLSAFDDGDLADAAEWDGDPFVFVGALIDCGPGGRPGFVDPDRRLHNWEARGGVYLRRRIAGQKGASARWAKQSPEQPEHANAMRSHSDGTATVERTDCGRNAEEKRREITPPTPPALAPVDNEQDSSSEDPRVAQALAIVAARRVTDGRSRTPRYLAKITENMRGDEGLDIDAARLCADFPTAPASLIAQRLEGDPCPNLAHYRAESA